MKRKLLLLFIILGFATYTFWSVAASSETVKEEYDEDEYGPADPIIWTRPVAGVIFEHRTHTLETGLDCDSCHDDNFEMLAGMAEEEDDFTMKSMEEGRYCGNCHYEGGFAFSVKTRCTSCHIGVRGVKRLELEQNDQAESQ